MLEILLITVSSSFFLICFGHILNLKDKTICKFDIYSKQIIYGLIFISFVSRSESWIFVEFFNVFTLIFFLEYFLYIWQNLPYIELNNK